MTKIIPLLLIPDARHFRAPANVHVNSNTVQHLNNTDDLHTAWPRLEEKENPPLPKLQSSLRFKVSLVIKRRRHTTSRGKEDPHKYSYWKWAYSLTGGDGFQIRRPDYCSTVGMHPTLPGAPLTPQWQGCRERSFLDFPAKEVLHYLAQYISCTESTSLGKKL